MGMSTRVIGLVSENDPTYKKHAKVLIACIEAGVKELPKETAEYFGSSYPERYLLVEKLTVEIPKRKYNADMEEGLEIVVRDIPAGVEVIRFVNSW